MKEITYLTVHRDIGIYTTWFPTSKGIEPSTYVDPDLEQSNTIEPQYNKNKNKIKNIYYSNQGSITSTH